MNGLMRSEEPGLALDMLVRVVPYSSRSDGIRERSGSKARYSTYAVVGHFPFICKRGSRIFDSRLGQ